MTGSAGGAGVTFQPRAQTPTTVVREAGPIQSFAQDGVGLAWVTDGTDTTSAVKERAAVGGSSATIARLDGRDAPYAFAAFALGGRRVVGSAFVACCNSGLGIVETAAPGSRPEELRTLRQEYWTWGDYPTGAAGAGRTLVYSVVTVGGGAGFWTVTGGGVRRVVGSRDVRIPGTPPPALLTAAPGMIALAPADRRKIPWHSGVGHRVPSVALSVAPDTRVEVRDAVSGALLASFIPHGRVTALGMDDRCVGVIARRAGRAYAESYSARTGTRVGSAPVPRDVADELDLAGTNLILRRGRLILLLDIRTGEILELAQAKAEPVGLSIERRRIAWAETTGRDANGYGGHGAIRALTLR